MLEKVISLFSGKTVSLFVSGVLAAVCFLAGVYVTRTYYVVKIDDISQQSALLISKSNEDAQKRLFEAINERDNAREKLDSVNRTVDDLLVRLQRSEGRSSTKSGQGSGNDDGAALARCRSLLSEGGKLLAEGCERYGKCAADADALAKLVK